jgi:transketolase
MDSIKNELSQKLKDKPLCLILDTVKGKGVSFMEDPAWHCKVPTEEEYKIAIKELGV